MTVLVMLVVWFGGLAAAVAGWTLLVYATRRRRRVFDAHVERVFAIVDDCPPTVELDRWLS